MRVLNARRDETWRVTWEYRMTTQDCIRGTIEMGHYITNEYLGDLSDADLLIRAVPGMNHIAWQLGHLIASEHQMMSAIGAKMPELPAGFAAAHSKETATSDDPAKFARKGELLALLRKMHDATLAHLSATPAARFDDPAPEEMRSYAPKVGDVFRLIGEHELMHVGQFVAVRRKLGKPVKI